MTRKLMPVLDIHVHMGRRHHLTPWVLAFLAGHIGQGALQTLEGITPADFEAFIKIEGVDRAVLLAEYSPKTTGVVPNEFTAGFCQGSDVLIPFGSVNLEDEVDAGTQVERC
ncbi:MAG: hypothetical protein FJY85_16095, partial [Deltaproteobacteria bacterium]|nr:hypothetical protein [Deltaproteobacteria bacterium]